MQHIGEVIEASSTMWVTGAYALLNAPPFGALIKAGCHESDVCIYGLVYDIRTGSREPNGRAMVRGGRRYDGSEFYDDQIYSEHPDLAAVLQTEWSALIVGYKYNDRINYHLPPQPPTVHYSVDLCDEHDLAEFTASCDYFRMVLKSPAVPSEDLLGTTLRHAAELQTNRHAYELKAGRELARILRDDYDRLRTIVRMFASRG